MYILLNIVRIATIVSSLMFVYIPNFGYYVAQKVKLGNMKYCRAITFAGGENRKECANKVCALAQWHTTGSRSLVFWSACTNKIVSEGDRFSPGFVSGLYLVTGADSPLWACYTHIHEAHISTETLYRYCGEHDCYCVYLVVVLHKVARIGAVLMRD